MSAKIPTTPEIRNDDPTTSQATGLSSTEHLSTFVTDFSIVSTKVLYEPDLYQDLRNF